MFAALIESIVIFALLFKRGTVKLGDTTIPFEGLKLGLHHYTFELDNAFFLSFEGSEIESAKLTAVVDLEKKESMMEFSIALSGIVKTMCDRCGSDVDLELDADYSLVVKFGEQTEQQDTDILILGPAEHEVDLGKYFFEYAHVSLPLKRVHEDEDDCNQDALDALDQFSFTPDDDTDPRWDALKKLKKD